MVGPQDLLLGLVLAVFFFGAKKLPEMLQDKDPEKAKRVMTAMLKMKKIDIDALKQAYGGR